MQIQGVPPPDAVVLHPAPGFELMMPYMIVRKCGYPAER